MITDLIPDPDRYRFDHGQLRLHTHPVEADCLQALEQFQAHDLDNQIKVSLMNRTESKYLLPIGILPDFLRSMAKNHTVLQHAGHRVFTYENTYFDTPDWDLYLHHHNGKLNRYKYRYRRYHETNVACLELKYKNNKRRTVKERLPWPCNVPGELSFARLPFLARLYINYRRITLWNHTTDERMTLDYDIYFQRPQQAHKESRVRLQSLFIIELKRAGKVYGSPFVRQAKDDGYHRQSISKYCVGVCLTETGKLKRNKFKPVLRKLHNLQHAGVTMQ